MTRKHKWKPLFPITRRIISKTLSDSFTNWNGDVVPSRLCYAIVMLFGVVFIWLTIYDTLQHKSFNSLAFSGGCASIGALIISAAAGVRVSQPAEAPFPLTPPLVTTPSSSDLPPGPPPAC